MSEATVDDLVKEAKAPGNFNILNVLKEMSHPSDTVNVYLDEQSSYDAALVKERIKEIEKAEVDSGFQLSKELKSELLGLNKKLDAFLVKLEENKYVFTITGISEGKREELLTKATKAFPIEYEEIKNPITTEVSKKEIDNQERNDLFTELIWKEHITKITAPDGSEQTDFTLEDIQQLRPALPIASIGAITEAIEKLRVATAVFMMTVDEDFLAKS
jgi:hypothetical protein